MSRFLRNTLRCSIVLTVLLVCLTGCSGVRSVPTAAQSPVDFSRPKPVSWELPNGLTVLFLADPEMPLLSGTLYIPGGSLWESSQESGRVSAMGGQMRQGGAGSLTADQLDAELEELSASVSSSIGGEFGEFSFFCLEEDADQVLSILADVVLRPRFEQQRFDLWKGQLIESIRRRSDDPNTMASITFDEILYGSQSPYGRVLTSQEVRRISRVDLLRAHRNFINPRNALFAISGSIDRNELERLLLKHFATWEPRTAEIPDPPGVEEAKTRGIYFIEKPVVQSTVIMGHLGVRRLSEDYVAIHAFNDIFGSSGFSSKLMKKIRADSGLAYSVYGSIIPGIVKGKNLIALQTKSESTAQAIEESMNVLAEMQTELVSEKDLDTVKRSLSNAFVFKFDSAGKVVAREALLDLLKYPEDYDDRYLERLEAVNREEVRTVARRRWNLDDFVIVVVGNENAYNSLVSEVSDNSSVLHGFSLQRVRFDEKPRL